MRNIRTDLAVAPTFLRIIRISFQAVPFRSTLLIIASAIFAVAPAVQVLLMAELVRQMGAGGADPGRLFLTLSLIVLFIGLFGPLHNMRDLIAEVVQLRSGARLQGLLADCAASLEPQEVVEGDLGSEIEGHSRAIVDHVSGLYPDTLRALEALAGAIGVVLTLANYSPVAALLTLLTIVPSLFVGVRVSREQKHMWSLLGKVYRRERYLRETLSSRAALLELTAFGTMHRVAGWEKAQQRLICDVREKPIAVGLAATGIAAALNAVFFAGAIVVTVADLGIDSTTIAAVYGVFGAVTAIAAGGGQLTQIVQYVPTAARLMKFLERVPQTSASAATEHVVRKQLMLSNVSARYSSSGKDVIKGIDFSVARGEMVAIVGRNGAGKTTLLNVLLGLIPTSDGALIADGEIVTPRAEAAWLRNFGFMAQDFGRYEVTVRDAVQLGTGKPADDADIVKALRSAQAKEFVMQLPSGLDTRLGEAWGGVGLSGGQWQRLALARIYLRDSPVWILDEPSSAIDAESEVKLFQELGARRSERMTVVVSHRAWTLRSMDRIYMVDGGRIVEQGSFEELTGASGPFATLFSQQTSKAKEGDHIV